MKESLCPTFDQAFAALVADLDERGLLGQTLVLANAEFGRTPKINSGAGRDHWPWVYSIALAGGGVGRGVVYGSSDKVAAYPDVAPARSPRPGRDDLPPAGRPGRHDRPRPGVAAASRW